MRDEINAGLKDAIKARDTRRTTTLRLINAAIKDRDIAARGEGREKVSDEDILALLQKMVKQREESIAVYIKDYLPKPLSEEEVAAAIDDAVAETGAEGLRDMGKVVNALKAKFPGRIDFGKASKLVKEKLGA